VLAAKIFCWITSFVLMALFVAEKLKIYSFDVPLWVLLSFVALAIVGLLLDRARGS
jgi:hypothetical protein